MQLTPNPVKITRWIGPLATICTTCGNERPRGDRRRRRSGSWWCCRDCRRRYDRRRYRYIKDQIHARYGSQCALCRCCNPLFLTIDHVNGRGREHRARLGSRGMYRSIWNEGYRPDKYRILCFNCNCALGHYTEEEVKASILETRNPLEKEKSR